MVLETILQWKCTRKVNMPLLTVYALHIMLVTERSRKEENVIQIPYSALTLGEALYLLTNYHEGYFDAGKQTLILNEVED